MQQLELAVTLFFVFLIGFETGFFFLFTIAGIKQYRHDKTTKKNNEKNLDSSNESRR